MSTVAVAMDRLSKRYKKLVALDEISLQINQGEIFGLVGPDGGGKSSILKSVAGVLSYDSGHLTVLGQEIDSEKSAEKIKSRIGFMAQGLGQNLYRELSVEENIDHFARIRLVENHKLEESKARLLEITRLSSFKDRPVKKLSGGMKQKLGLVCTLIHSPELIILDEPTTGVDPVSRRDFWWILERLVAQQKITVLVSSAYMDEAARFKNTALVHQGRVLAKGSLDQINNLISGLVVSVGIDKPIAAYQTLVADYSQIEITANGLRIYCQGQNYSALVADIHSKLAAHSISYCHQDETSLDDTFLALVEKHDADKTSSSTGLFEQSQSWTELDGGGGTDRPLIHADNLVQQFGDFKAVDGVSFDVSKGQIFGLLGANGAGKTTVIKMLTGLLTPTSGDGSVAGVKVKNGKQIKQKIGYVSQAFSLYLDLTVIENLRLYGSIYGVAKEQLKSRIQWMLELMELTPYQNSMSAQLPLGLRQRLALGCALIHHPAVLFLDEPTSGVDPVGRRRFWEIIYHISREYNVTVLITTHYMAEAEHCDRLAIMYAGKIIANDTPKMLIEGLRKQSGELMALTTSQPFELLQLLEQNGFQQTGMVGNAVHLHIKKDSAQQHTLEKLLHQQEIQVIKQRQIPITIEDVFVSEVVSREKKDRRG